MSATILNCYGRKIMKIRELKENEPLKVTRVTYHFPAWPDPSTGKVDKDAKPIEDERIKTIIFTDGEIEKQTEETFQSIEEYYIGKSKYHMTVDTLETKNIYFKNHSYVITYLLAKEFMIKGHVRGWFDVIKDVSIYLENGKDKKALREAKIFIKQINECNDYTNYLSSWGLQLPEYEELEKISKNAYTLKKLNK